jgi:hypothetical protein
VPCNFHFIAPAHFLFYITRMLFFVFSVNSLCLRQHIFINTDHIVQLLQTAGAIGGIAASLVRVPTEVCNFISYYYSM